MPVSGVWRYDQEQPFSPATATAGGEFARLFFSNRPRWKAATGCGVVTAADECYFPGLQFLQLSLAERCPLCVFDCGLAGDQVHWLHARGARVVQVVDADLIVPRFEPMWVGWNKPAFLAASPFEVTLWIDSDAFVVNDLAPLFAVAYHQPLLFQHVDPQVYGAVNHEDLYRRFPVKGPRVVHGLQNAVFGYSWERDKGLVSEWGRACAQFVEPDLNRLCRCWDQGALLWAVESLSLGWCCRPSGGWNRFAWPNAAFGLGSIEAFFNSFSAFVDDVVLHFVGRPKYWVNWGKYVPLG